MVWLKVLVLILIFKECSGAYEFDLFGSVGLSANDPPAGVEVIQLKPNEAPSFDISKYNGPGLSVGGNQYAFVATAFRNSDDISFVSEVRLDKFAIGKHVLFSLQSEESSATQYLTVAINVEEGSAVEGEKTGGTAKFLEVFRSTLKTRDTIRLDGKIEEGKPFTLNVRFQSKSDGGKRKKRDTSKDVTSMIVSVDCKEVDRKDLFKSLTDQSDSNIELLGMLSVGMLYDKREAKSVFSGAIGSPRVLNGKDAFEMLNPCTELPTQNVPSEPTLGEYDPTFFERFVKMTSANIHPVTLFCVDENGKQYSSGAVWYSRKRCIKNTCNAGFISTDKDICVKCTIGDLIFFRDEDVIDPAEPCIKKYCSNTGEVKNIRFEKPIECKNLNCDKFGEVKKDGECCPKCKSDTCDKPNTTYKEGCKRRCSDGPSYKCTTKSTDCFCKEGYLLDDNDVCIPSRECPCKVDSKIYQPGQSVEKSRCSNCICSQGKLRCLNKC